MERVTAGVSIGKEKTAVWKGKGKGTDTDCLDDVEEDWCCKGGIVLCTCV